MPLLNIIPEIPPVPGSIWGAVARLGAWHMGCIHCEPHRPLDAPDIRSAAGSTHRLDPRDTSPWTPQHSSPTTPASLASSTIFTLDRFTMSSHRENAAATARQNHRIQHWRCAFQLPLRWLNLPTRGTTASSQSRSSPCYQCAGKPGLGARSSMFVVSPMGRVDVR